MGVQSPSTLPTFCLENLLSGPTNSFLGLMNTELFNLMVATVDSLTMMTNLKHDFAWPVTNLSIVFHD